VLDVVVLVVVVETAELRARDTTVLEVSLFLK
jgi:hypothetical protein